LTNEKGLIPIPEKLKILPTDTEEEKLRKKKKLKAIKNHNRNVSRELEMQETQQSWKKFINKGTKRSLTGVTKSSIFATTEDVQGKVGVVNSGKGLTEFSQRKKHQFQLS
jgi:survival of motor neuron-related-splicing factor 30